MATCGSQTGGESQCSSHDLLEITVKSVSRSKVPCRSLGVQVGSFISHKETSPLRASAQVQVGDSLAAEAESQVSLGGGTGELVSSDVEPCAREHSDELFTDSGESRGNAVSKDHRVSESSADAFIRGQTSNTKRVSFEEEGNRVSFLLECDECEASQTKRAVTLVKVTPRSKLQNDPAMESIMEVSQTLSQELQYHLKV